MTDEATKLLKVARDLLCYGAFHDGTHSDCEACEYVADTDKFLSREAPAAEAPTERYREALQALADRGTHHDLTPTMFFKGDDKAMYADMCGYLRGADELVRRIARQALQPDVAAPSPAPAAEPPGCPTPGACSCPGAPVVEHEWFKRSERDAFECCRLCGIVRNPNGGNRPCRGRVRVELREQFSPPQPESAPAPAAEPTCHCATCDPVTADPATHRMVLCPKCGDKRCPHAADHRNACTAASAAPAPADGLANDVRNMIEQLCKDLNGAHDEILKLQGVKPDDFGRYDWPEWTPQANSIRWAEELLGKRLAKTTAWSLFP